MKAKAVTTKQANTRANTKQITLRTLRELKAKMYARAARAAKEYPGKSARIQQRVDADASRIAFAINLVSSKM